MSVVVPLYLLAPLVIVPLGYRLLEFGSPASRPSALVLRLVLPAAALLVLAFGLPVGPLAGALALPWVAVTGATALAAAARWMRDPDRFQPGVRHAVDAAVAFLAVGAAFALTDRLGIQPFGFSSTIILLTAVHFHFAGFVLPLAGALAFVRRPRRWLELAIGAVVVGIPITALGFFGLPLANWVGAVLTATGGFVIGVATIALTRTLARRAAVLLAIVAGSSLLVSMPMAAVYATAVLAGGDWLGLESMARIHGGLNALGFALSAMLAWTLDRRARMVAEPASPRPGRDSRRLGLGAAAIIAGYACVVGLISANAGADSLGAPTVIPRPVSLALLLMLPAAVAVIAALRRSRPLFVAAGILCLAESVIAFSGVTLPFIVPALLLLSLGVAGRQPASPRAAIGSVLVIALGIWAWVATFAMTETICWIARTGADGSLVYARIPVTDSQTVGIGDVASVAEGCDGGVTTVEGIALAAILGLGALAVAELASRRPTGTARPGDHPGAWPAGPLDVMRFNVRLFVLGPLLAIAAAAVSLVATSLPPLLRVALCAAAVGATILTVSAVTAIVWVFRIGARRRWEWVRDASASPRSWLNVTTGFDDSTATLRQILPASTGVAFDAFDPAIEHEAALMTARSRFLPSEHHGSASELARAIGVGTQDAVFLLMSAHEARDRDRAALFEAIRQALAPAGRLILVEHLRDLPNRIAFGPGANHFQTRESWLQAAAAAGLAEISSARLTPYVHGFVFQRAGS